MSEIKKSIISWEYKNAVYGNDEFDDFSVDDEFDIWTEDGTFIGCVDNETNARLIAAAPEMCEMIKNELKAEYVFGKYDNFSMFEFNNKKKIDLFEKATGLKIEEVIK